MNGFNNLPALNIIKFYSMIESIAYMLFPLGMSPNMLYSPHLPRSSPTTATAIASATITIQNMPPNSIPPFATRGAAGAFGNHQYQVNTHTQVDYSKSKSSYAMGQHMYNDGKQVHMYIIYEYDHKLWF